MKQEGETLITRMMNLPKAIPNGLGTWILGEIAAAGSKHG
jgi:hypothetical protein